MSSHPTRSVLITGCSDGGIGNGLASAFHDKGYLVFATARNVKKMSSIADLPNIHLLQLDVQDMASVEEAAAEVAKITHGKLDVLVNNAGITQVIPALDTSLNDAQLQFDINFFGTIRVTQAFAAQIISAKGLIVNVCSINAYLNPPWQSVYSASKAAQESWSETL